MKREQFRSVDNVVFLPFWSAPARAVDEVDDETLAELRELWPSVVDLAKQPGLLCRMHALLSD